MKPKIPPSKKPLLIFFLLLLLCAFFLKVNISNLISGKVDDWMFTPEYEITWRGGIQAPAVAKEGIGFSVGGAKDINNFRENIKNGYLPLETDITYEGLFYDYYFNTTLNKECKELFCPAYSLAISKDPFSNQINHYLAVGLHSGLKASEFKRKKLNLVIVLDISGSMSSPLDIYYYDKFFGKNRTSKNPKPKIEIAKEVLIGITKHLNDEDRFGIVLFNNKGYIAKPLRKVEETDMDAIRNHISELTARGGTCFECGYKKATELFNGVELNDTEYENRIIFITDAMPNIGALDEDKLLGLTRKNAERRIYTTFVGVGVDFNTELVEYISKTKGCNYFSVHSEEEFKEKLDKYFDYVVTPLVFNLQLKIESDAFEIEKVYGSPEANESTGEIMKVSTLFPSEKKEEGVRGGIILIKLKKKSNSSAVDLKLVLTYEDRNGKEYKIEEVVSFPASEREFYEDNGIRKAILLARYADLMKNWISYERSKIHKQTCTCRIIEPLEYYEKGIIPPYCICLSKWERTSDPLTVSKEYREIISKFSEHFRNEMQKIGDNSLEKELEILEILTERK